MTRGDGVGGCFALVLYGGAAAVAAIWAIVHVLRGGRRRKRLEEFVASSGFALDARPSAPLPLPFSILQRGQNRVVASTVAARHRAAGGADVEVGLHEYGFDVLLHRHPADLHLHGYPALRFRFGLAVALVKTPLPLVELFPFGMSGSLSATLGPAVEWPPDDEAFRGAFRLREPDGAAATRLLDADLRALLVRLGRGFGVSFGGDRVIAWYCHDPDAECHAALLRLVGELAAALDARPVAAPSADAGPAAA
jgi:hypothetical protein